MIQPGTGYLSLFSVGFILAEEMILEQSMLYPVPLESTRSASVAGTCDYSPKSVSLVSPLPYLFNHFRLELVVLSLISEKVNRVAFAGAPSAEGLE
jgi:hypothetical protein